MNVSTLIQVVALFVVVDMTIADTTPRELALASNGIVTAADVGRVAVFFARCGSARRAAFFASVAAEMTRCDEALVVQAELPDLDGMCGMCIDGLRHDHV